ncbi:MAG: hypothetical protein PHG00_12700 [Methylococcales bacterium]|nr:hypothetical protein [Methylococcales bacterium]
MNTESSADKMNYKFLCALLMLFIASCSMAGCEKEDQSTPPLPKTLKKYDKATVLEGSVSDNHGPVKAGVIKVTDNNEQLGTSTTLQGSNLYTVEIPANTILPIVLTFYPDAQNDDAEKLVTAIVHAAITQYDINP